MSVDHLDDVGDVPFSFAGWRTRASRRVLHSTSAVAEAQAAAETLAWQSMTKHVYAMSISDMPTGRVLTPAVKAKFQSPSPQIANLYPTIQRRGVRARR